MDATALKVALVKRGIGTNDLAGILGINPSLASLKIHGKQQFTYTQIKRLASKLQLDNEEIINIFFAQSVH